jgi:alkanesulfonate monooxygenase SsuD/methylene tetrahydromethanopterin reductase-like flavin-dependent oxidoreductase (luciferase family)
MEVGLFLTNQQPLGRDMTRALGEQLEMVSFVRDHGWNSVFTGHHYLTDSSAQLQPIPFLARLAAETGDMRLGIGILLLSLLNPVAVAEDVASLDVITGGKVVLGVGLGYRATEFDAFGVPKGQRVSRFVSNLNVLMKLWSGDDVDTDLPWCRLKSARLTTMPVQRPRPPIWIGATSDKAVTRAGTLADGWIVNPAATDSTVLRQKSLYLEATSRSNRVGKNTIAVFKEIFCAEDRQEAIRLCQPYLLDKYRAYASWGQASAHPETKSLNLAFDDLQRQRFIIGSPEDCFESMRWWQTEVGVSHFLIRTHWTGMSYETSLASLRLLAEQVIPRLRTQAT